MAENTQTKHKLIRMQKLRHAIDRLRHTRREDQRAGQRSLLTRIKARLNAVLGKELPEEE